MPSTRPTSRAGSPWPTGKTTGLPTWIPAFTAPCCATAGRDSICHATATLAEMVGKAVRTVQESIQRLIDAGYLRRVYDGKLRTRRRLVLVDFAPSSPAWRHPRQARKTALWTREIPRLGRTTL